MCGKSAVKVIGAPSLWHKRQIFGACIEADFLAFHAVNITSFFFGIVGDALKRVRKLCETQKGKG
jgi:hypothetical protein